jgi:mannosyltransferase
MASVSRAARGPVIGLAAVVAAAAVVRWWRIGLPGLTSDEAFSWRLAGYPVGEIVRRTAEDVHSPLFYLLLKPWLALTGESPLALRGLSVLLGLAAVILTWRLVVEAGGPRAAAGGLVAAALVALHPLHVQQGRNARMYALGILLAALTALLLLRALRAGGTAWRWWVAYGLAAGAFVYTHYYALFTLAAQGVGAVVLATSKLRHAARVPVPAMRGLALSAGVALLVLAPWLPAFAGQARRVQQEYWIPAASAGDLGGAFVRWLTALPPGPVAIAAAALIVVLVAWGGLRAGAVAAFFALQAMVPWVLALAVSALGRPLFLERFTVFAHVGLAALVGVAWQHLDRVSRIVAALVLAACIAAGLGTLLRGLPDRPPAVTQVIRQVRRLQQPGDVVVADSPRALNKLLFYARQDGLDGVPLRTLPGIAGGGHYTHHASLQPGELVQDVTQAASGPRLWRATERPDPVPPAPPGWTMRFARVFDGGEGSRYLLVRYERAP